MEAFRKTVHDWILHTDPGPEFRSALRQRLQKRFGADGSYGVFVRSDTNVEDEPGFSGAGLNLTVPNVVGFDNIVSAIQQVWASPFSARAFAWRRTAMAASVHVYPAILLLKSVNVEKSGVLVTKDIDSGNRDWLSVAVNEGVGGAVSGQAAESLRINRRTGEVRLMAEASAPFRQQLNPGGGMIKLRASGDDQILQPDEIRKLVAFADSLPHRFPPIVDAQGRPVPADVEFGFLEGKLWLFQIRPFLESASTRADAYLRSMDSARRTRADEVVLLDAVPK
jgi:phosphoenolpyruvate synthase/pyruvate phosphate dikinase